MGRPATVRGGRSLAAAALAGLLSAGLFSAGATARAADAPSWIPVWAASPERGAAGPEGAPPSLNGQTIRERMRLSFGGRRVRVRFSNEFGAAPLLIGAATLALPTSPNDVKAGSVKPITFGGHASVTIPPGAPMLSDPVDLGVTGGEEVTISVYTPGAVGIPTLHILGLKTAVVTPPGDFTAALHVEAASTTLASMLVSAILVSTPEGASKPATVIVAFGDSITDGNNSSVDADKNWPDDVARRLSTAGFGGPVAIVNEAISGNQLRRDGAGISALARFDRDVLSLPGVTHIVLLEGINDLGWPGALYGDHLLEDASALPTADDLIVAYKQLVERAHEHGVKIIASTLTPWEGTDLPGYYSQPKEAIRQTVNQWIRTGGAFDGVVDFDKVLRDPQRPQRMLPPFPSRDHLHPSDAGYQAMADALDLDLFKPGKVKP